MITCVIRGSGLNPRTLNNRLRQFSFYFIQAVAKSRSLNGGEVYHAVCTLIYTRMHGSLNEQQEIPQLKGHWFYGSLRELNKSPHSFFANAGPKDHGLFQFNILHKKMVSVVDADCAMHIFKSNSQNYIRGANFKKLQAILGLGLICLEGDLWKQHRRFVAPAFKPDFLKYSLSQNIQLIHSLLEDWTRHSVESKPIELVDQMRRFTLSVIVKALFSIDIDLKENQQLYQAIVEANDLIFRRIFAPFAFPN